MSAYSITLKPVYSQTVATPDGVSLPTGWSLSWHQAETFKALSNSSIDVVFNTAMTGDGKSLAAYLDVMQGNLNSIGLYPTNELARDQERQVQDYVEKFQPPGKPRIVRLSGEDLEIYAENANLRKADALATRTSQREILLTNPDILYYLHRGAYLINKENPDKLWGRIDEDFELFIFDEFHLFSAPQVVGILNTLLLIRRTNRRKKYLFLSATPNRDLLDRLALAGLRCEAVSPEQQGKYCFPNTSEECIKLEAGSWRKVARAITLNFISLEIASKACETWLKENSQLIVDHFQQHPGSKGAIILNSIAAVKRLTPFFEALLKPYGLEVGENTGLSGRDRKVRSLSADLVLGTSTIDVGVDFKINFLLFESSDSGTFIQRLGRLGRHDGYEKNGQDVRFTTFTAYALAPNFLVEKLFLDESHPFETRGLYDRTFFNQNIRSCYWEPNDFRRYYSRWGGIQSVDLAGPHGLGQKYIKQVYAGSQEAFKDDCEKLFESKFGRIIGCLKKWRMEYESTFSTDGNPIADEAVKFRGSSPLQCGILDLTESYEADKFKTYDLPGILSNLEIEMMTKVEFERTLDQTAARLKQPIAKGRFDYCFAFIKLLSYREERLNWRFTYPSENLQAIANSWRVQVLQGIQVWQPENRWISKINERLKTQTLVCFVVQCRVSEVRKKLRLPMHFQLYPIDEVGERDRDPIYSIAFGQSALMLETVSYRLQNSGDEIWIC